jgi:hypothetical protein
MILAMLNSNAWADETQINLDPQTPYVDIPIEATEPTQITIQTTNGTPQTNPGFIDSWVELWQGVNKLFADDDGAHSATNVLASYINAPIQAGTYFIRATSFAWMASNQTQTPTGTYLLTWNGVTTIPTASPSPTPSIEPTPTIEPTPSPTQTETESPSPTPTQSPTEQVSPTPTATDSFTPSPEPTASETQEQTNRQTEPEAIVPLETPSPTQEPETQDLLEQELENQQQIPADQSNETPIVDQQFTPEQIQEQIDLEYIQENTIELSIPTSLENIPGLTEIFAATEAILNVGSDMTQEQREESQSVVIASIVLTQIAQISAIAATTQRTRK